LDHHVLGGKRLAQSQRAPARGVEADGDFLL
jgi:hypothetical protein